MTALALHLSAVIPDPTRHIIACAQQKVGQMWTPRDLSNGVLVSLKQLQRTGRLTYVEGADDAIHTCSGENRTAVFVPVVCECLGRGKGGLWFRHHRGGYWWSVDGDLQDQVVACTGWRSQIPDPHVAVRAHSA